MVCRVCAHAPRNRHDFKRAAKDMRARGLATPDIASVLKLTNNAVRELLDDAPAELPLHYLWGPKRR